MAHNSPTRRQAVLLLIAYLGFISLGLPDTLIGVAWPKVRDHFNQPQAGLSWIFFGSGCGYLLSSFFSGKLVKAISIGALLAVSSALVAVSGFGYALSPLWILFVAASIFHGLGSGAIDAGLNHYVAHHFSARHMNWLHACYSVGATIGPIVMTGFIVRSGSWSGGYVVVSIVLLFLSVLFLVTRQRWNEGPGPNDSEEKLDPHAGIGTAAALCHPTVRLHVLLFFIYTGLEVTIGQWSFTVLTEWRQFEAKSAGMAVTLYWGAILAGRVLFGFLVDRIGVDRLVRGSISLAVLGAAVFVANFSRELSIASLGAMGLGLAAVYPCLMTKTPERLGKALAAHAIGFQVGAAMIGAAVLPSASGFLGQQLGLGMIPICAVVMAMGLFLLHEQLLRGDRRANEGQ